MSDSRTDPLRVSDMVQKKYKYKCNTWGRNKKKHASRYRLHGQDWVSRKCQEQNRLFGDGCGNCRMLGERKYAETNRDKPRADQPNKLFVVISLLQNLGLGIAALGWVPTCQCMYIFFCMIGNVNYSSNSRVVMDHKFLFHTSCNNACIYFGLSIIVMLLFKYDIII